MTTRLGGRRILVTRPRAQAEGLAMLIRGAGGIALVFPTLEILPPVDVHPLRALLGRLEEFDLAIFISGNAVERGLALLGRPWPAGLQVAAIGTSTRRLLEERGLKDVLAPPGQADSEALLGLPQLERLEGRAVVIFRGAGGREQLRDTLLQRGARVEYAECYRRARPAAPNAAQQAEVVAALARGDIDAVSVNSAEALANLRTMLGEVGARPLARTPLFVPHRRVAEEAATLGLPGALVAGPSDREVLERLVAYFVQGS